MSGCTRCRWGTNTNPDRPENTENAKRLESGLQNLLAERQNMDTMWSPPEIQTQVTPPTPKPTLPSQPIPIPKKTELIPPPSTPRPSFFEPSKPPQKKDYSGILYN
jgi:hypothetical protein